MGQRDSYRQELESFDLPIGYLLRCASYELEKTTDLVQIPARTRQDLGAERALGDACPGCDGDRRGSRQGSWMGTSDRPGRHLQGAPCRNSRSNYRDGRGIRPDHAYLLVRVGRQPVREIQLSQHL